MLAADLVVTLGEAMREEIVARGVPAEKILIVPNAVSEEFLQPLPDAAALRDELGIAPDEHVVGVVSSLVPHEGIGTLLEATAMLRAPRPAGPGADRRRRARTRRPAASGGGARPGRGGRLHRPRARGESTSNSTRSSMFSSFRARRTGLSARYPAEADRGDGQRTVRGH